MGTAGGGGQTAHGLLAPDAGGATASGQESRRGLRQPWAEMQQRALCHEAATQQLIERVSALETRPASMAGGSIAPPSAASAAGAGRDPFKFDAKIVRANVPGVGGARCKPRSMQRNCPSEISTWWDPKKKTVSADVLWCGAWSHGTGQRSWRAPSPSRCAEAPSGAVSPLYVALDECPAHIVRKKATKREAAGAQTKLHVSQCDGIVTVAWVPWAEVRFVPATVSAQVVWHDAAIRAAGAEQAGGQRG